MMFAPEGHREEHRIVAVRDPRRSKYGNNPDVAKFDREGRRKFCATTRARRMRAKRNEKLYK